MSGSTDAPRIERTCPTVLTVRFDVPNTSWERWVLLRSDVHHDNLLCDQALEKRHLDEAAARDALIFDFGDLFCAMQGKWDKRADPNQLRPELRGPRYLDELVAFNAAFLEPYAPLIVVLAEGNHESAIRRRHETNLGERLAERLRLKGSPVQNMPYAGWIRFLFTLHGTSRHNILLRYTHGYGGTAPVTRGVIQTAREAAFLCNADILVSGHIHESYHLTIRREVLLMSGRPVLKDMECIRCPGYKDEFSCGEGWAVEKGLSPKPKGAWWLHFTVTPQRNGSKRCGVSFELVRAK